MILSGPNQSTSIQIINGSQSASITYSLFSRQSLLNFTIGSASINSTGKTYKSNSLSNSVLKVSQKINNKNSNEISETEIAKNLYVRALLIKQKLIKASR
jgi:hypothetical protein